jgi:ketosteroid isomerase-like protein
MGEPTTQALRARYREYIDAMNTAQFDAVASIMLPTFESIDPIGDRRTKAEYLHMGETLTAGHLTCDLGSIDVTIRGDIGTAVTVYNMNGAYTDGYVPTAAIRVTSTWWHDGSDWRFAAQQGSYIGAEQ